MAPYLRLPLDTAAVTSVTRGLVGDTSFAVLPNITPRATFFLTLAAQIVGLNLTPPHLGRKLISLSPP